MFVNYALNSQREDFSNLPLFALAICVAGGPYLFPVKVAGFAVFGFRVVAVGLIILYLLFNRMPRIEWTSTTKASLVALSVWLIWGIASGIWAPDFVAWMSDIVNLGIGIAFILAVLLSTFGRRNALQQLRLYWSIGYWGCLAIAVYERLTGTHLPSAWKDAAGITSLTTLAQSTFGNPNNYASYAILTSPLVIWGMIDTARSRRWFYFGFYAATFTTVPVVMYLTASRLALAALIVQLFVLWIFSIRRPKVFIVLTSIGVIFSIYGAGIFAKNEVIAAKLGRVESELSRNSGSIGTRVNLSLAGLWMVHQTGGLGVGAGGYPEIAVGTEQPYRIGKLSNPHNYLIEIASQYGLPILALVLLWIGYLGWLSIYLLRRLWSGDLEKLPLAYQSGIMVFPILWVSYCFISAAHSSFITNHVNWSGLALLIVFASRFEYQINDRNLYAK